MGDIRDLGPTGQAVFAKAEALHKAGHIDQAQFDELKNTNVGKQDIAIGNAALNKLMGVKLEDTEGVKLFMSIPQMNREIMQLQRDTLQNKTQQQAKPEKSLGASLGEFMNLFGSMNAMDIVRNIRG